MRQLPTDSIPSFLERRNRNAEVNVSVDRREQKRSEYKGKPVRWGKLYLENRGRVRLPSRKSNGCAGTTKLRYYCVFVRWIVSIGANRPLCNEFQQSAFQKRHSLYPHECYRDVYHWLFSHWSYFEPRSATMVMVG